MIVFSFVHLVIVIGTDENVIQGWRESKEDEWGVVIYLGVIKVAKPNIATLAILGGDHDHILAVFFYTHRLIGRGKLEDLAGRF